MNLLRILRADNAIERAEWLEAWHTLPEREVFAHPAYVELFLQPGSAALAALACHESGGILFPFILRALDAEALAPPELPGLHDIVSAYGYGGAFCWGRKAGAGNRFWEEYQAWAATNRVVSEFVRLTLFPDTSIPYAGAVERRLTNVVRDLEPTEDQIWMDFDHKVRKNVKKAIRGGLTVEVDTEGKRLDDFLRIYTGTMNRRGAGRQYYFSRRFFEDLCQNLSRQFVFFHALQGAEVVSSELVLLSQTSAYSFLGGTRQSAFDLRPNDLLKHEIIIWCKRQRKRRFVLGGGHEEGDGIYRYKRSFAPSGEVPFFVGFRTHLPKIYQRLVEYRRERNGVSLRSSSYFPAYR